MTSLRALVFDVDGTLAETEELHRRAFNEAFEEAGIDWIWSRELYRELLSTTGGRERILVYAERVGAKVDAPILHARKTHIFGEFVRTGAINLRPGVVRLVEHAKSEGLALAIGTTTSRPNVTSLLEATFGHGAEKLFASIRTGEDVTIKKPDPEVYRLVLSDLQMAPEACLCFEDSRNGLLASRAAGIRTVITPSTYSAGEDFAGADLIIRNLDQPWSSIEFQPYKTLLDQPLWVSRILTGRSLSGAPGLRGRFAESSDLLA